MPCHRAPDMDAQTASGLVPSSSPRSQGGQGTSTIGKVVYGGTKAQSLSNL